MRTSVLRVPAGGDMLERKGVEKMRSDLSETIEEIGRRGEMEQDKLFCLLLSMQEKMRQELTEDPNYKQSLDLERLQSVIDDYRKHIRKGRDLFDKLTGWLKRLEQNTAGKQGEESESIYPMDTIYHMAVAEQEQDLQRLYPARFGGE